MGSRSSNVNSTLKRMQISKEDFTLTISNYSAKFSVNEKTLKKFNQNEVNPYVFGLANLIKKEIRTYSMSNNLPFFDRDRLPYYSYNKDLFLSDNSFDRVTNIDLRNCYSRVLFKEGIISESTYRKLLNISKTNRLVSVGFLAYEPYHFEFSKGNLISYEVIRNPYADYFYYCVNICGKIMQQLRFITGKNFIFTWVDGIYFVPDKTIETNVRKYLDRIEYDFSVDSLYDFSINNKVANCSVEFYGKKERKVFNIPLSDPKAEFNKNYIINQILKTNKNQNYGIKGYITPSKKFR